MRIRIFETVAAELEQALLNGQFKRLPRVIDLATRYEVSYPTMCKAIKLLVKKGLLISLPGRPLIIAPKARGEDPQQAPALPETSTDKLYATLKEGITAGEYEVGKPLPKITYFVLSHGVSSHTVRLAFSRLAAEGLAHNHRKQWFAGPAPSPTPPTHPRLTRSPSSSFVLTIAETPDHWDTLFTRSFTVRFAEPFTQEIARHNILLTPGMLRPSAALGRQQYGKSLGVPIGVEEIVEAAQRLGNQYRGTVVMRAHQQSLGQARDLIRKLATLKKSILYLDTNGDPRHWIRRKDVSLRKSYYQLAMDEEAAVRKVLTELLAWGHRNIAVHGANLSTWGSRRVRVLRQVAREFDPPLNVFSSDAHEPHWTSATSTELHALVDHAARDAGVAGFEDGLSIRQMTSFRDKLLSNASSLVHLLTQNRCTGLVALNDRFAREYYYWFKALGIEIPRHISLISFDNELSGLYQPITSVDFGFARLAYLAAHILIGDIPVRSDRYGVIRGECTLSSRGSVAEPGDTMQLQRLLS